MNSELREFYDHVIIHTSAIAAAAIGAAAPLPGSDAVLIMPVQLAMAAGLAVTRGTSLSEAVLGSAEPAFVAQVLGQGSARLLSAWVPGIGALVRGGVALTVTEGVGWALVRQYDAVRSAGEPVPA